MASDSRQDETMNPSARDRNAPRAEPAADGDHRQPRTSAPEYLTAGQERGIESVACLVPDTRDDIVVSRYE